MTTRDKYTEVPDPFSWEVPSVGDARFTWEYDEPRARLLSLYQKGKDKQWDAQSRIDWTQDVDPMNPVGLPDQFHPLFGSPMWESADEARRAEMRQHFQAWQFSQFHRCHEFQLFGIDDRGKRQEWHGAACVASASGHVLKKIC